MNNEKTMHLIGNAHIDPVWLWRFGEGFAEIKATFRSALDRIRDYDDFIFTCACASYYLWIEQNCPTMFEEIRQAVKAGKWKIVGGMWLQPDCNMPSSESFARHLLYSQRYFREKFGVTVRTGYNVDSFGHSAGLPRLLRGGGIENYIYMRPAQGDEKQYPFTDRTFLWSCGESEVLASRLPDPYCLNFSDTARLMQAEEEAEGMAHDTMLFYGVGNHGGGPTVTNIETIRAFRPHARRPMIFSDPDRFFDTIRQASLPLIPQYQGELQNHASGCYAANSRIKALNRQAENRLNEAERMEILAAAQMDSPTDAAANGAAWQKVLFNQFHDILCGCSIKAAYEDAYAFEGAAIAHALATANAAAQRISWDIDTSKGVAALSKECGGAIWEADNLGTPVVVFNPLSHAVRIPVSVHRYACAAVTDEQDTPIPHQIVRADYTNGERDRSFVRFLAEVPAYGWRTYWVYRERTFGEVAATDMMCAEQYRLSNGKLTVTFDEQSGEIASLRTADGTELLDCAARTVVIDDSENDTWAHNRFVFDKEIGVFGTPRFDVVEKGSCQVSLRVTQTFEGCNTLERTYTLYPHEEKLHVSAHLVLNRPLSLVKLTFDTGLKDAKFTREVPGGVVTVDVTGDAIERGRELPMLRYMLLSEKDRGLAVLNDCKYSSSAADGEMRMAVARSCYYADHYATRDGRMQLQDIGEQDFDYVLCPYHGDLAPVADAAEELNTDFPAITETYHRGTLPQTQCCAATNCDHVTVSAIKPAEDGRGIIVRLTETAGKNVTCTVRLLNTDISVELTPHAIATYRLYDGVVTPCDFTEEGIHDQQ